MMRSHIHIYESVTLICIDRAIAIATIHMHVRILH